jgi:hypothetical protein
MADGRIVVRAKLMLPKSFTMEIPSLGICHQITQESNGHKPSGPWLGSTSTYGLGDDKVCQA